MNDVKQDISTLIENSEKLTGLFGYWPTFHDAEILELHLWRGDVDPGAKRYIFPVLMMKMHTWELTNEVNEKGFYVLRHHTLVSLRFHDVSELRMEGFNQQNAIFGLSIEHKEGAFPSLFVIKMEPAFGVGAEFTCSRVEVVDALACSDEGVPISSQSALSG